VIYFFASKQEALSEMYMYMWGKEKGVPDGEEHFASNC